MHRTLRKLLPRAKGELRQAVVVFLDVRGFSAFAKEVESSEAVLFLRSIYVRILDEYFPNASFFKPTGDGLLVVMDYNDDTLQTVVRDAVRQSVRLIKGFSRLTTPDRMVNFDVPKQLGIGIARGAATAIVSGNTILDYSGRPLNLAARLMDLARPEGVIFSQSLDPNILTPTQRKAFVKQPVYVKGIADDEPLVCYALAGLVDIPEYNKHPLNRYEWKTLPRQTVPFKTLEQRGTFLHPLPVEPALRNDIRIHIRYPLARNGRRVEGRYTRRILRAQCVEREGRKFARATYTSLAAAMRAEGVKGPWPVTVAVEYAVRPD